MTEPPSVTVRYWAAARAAAGVETESVRPGTVAEVLRQVKERHADERFARIVDVCAIVHGETPLGTRDPDGVQVLVGDTLELLPPFAGG